MSTENISQNAEKYINFSVYNKIPSINLSNMGFSTKLLERDTTPIYSYRAKELIKGKVILVTGAGGSIGSEIVQQLVQLKAKEIYCLDNDEYSLYSLSLQLNGDALLTTENLILADVRDRKSMLRIFTQINPDIVYHAAAHKYLPLLERSPVEAINTNVFGTDNIISACIECEVKYFVNISTDKAARPVSVLGMTKRLAELCIAGYCGGITKVASVRFGNVLGSRGSFLQTLMWQIENEKPIQVTHPEVSRFFMTIPEAASLVIEASSLGLCGETYILDMGTSVKIVDLIDKFVRITGCKHPKIIYTGLREGEKLHEELLDPSEINTPTSHPLITKVDVDQFGIITDYDKMYLRAMVNLETSTEGIRDRLKELLDTIKNRTEVINIKQTVDVDLS
ncbi:MAG: polysaccharide biosynthesis protein [Methanosarcina barkeri]|nr:polysaccharide biosynthesis protein [Methanosarcina sp. ERenArc_MAG2]